jgi:hypothetical protein
MMIPPCNALYKRAQLDRSFVATELGLDVHDLSDRLHRIKEAAGIRGSSVWICLDDGEVYDPLNGEDIGNLYYT